MGLHLDFNGKIVLVTGSNSGIGAETALLFSELGAQLIIHGRDAAKVKYVAKQCLEVSPNKLKPLEVVADVEKEEEVNRLMDRVIEKFNRLDVVVNNAGVGGGRYDETLEGYDRYMNTNLRSVYQICLRSLPLLEQSNGVIVNNSSICAIKPAGLDMLTRCLAINWGPKGIRVNGVDPGQIDTPAWTNSVFMSPEQLSIMWKAVADKLPVRRKGYPGDIAKAIVFLASKESGFITGVNMKIDGGFLDSSQLISD